VDTGRGHAYLEVGIFRWLFHLIAHPDDFQPSNGQCGVATLGAEATRAETPSPTTAAATTTLPPPGTTTTEPIDMATRATPPPQPSAPVTVSAAPHDEPTTLVPSTTLEPSATIEIAPTESSEAPPPADSPTG
jgi:hypothetical protein